MPIFIAIAVTIIDDVRWKNPWFAYVLVMPFTLLGSFAILWPVHSALSRLVGRFTLWTPVIAVASLAGGALLGIIQPVWTVNSIGAICGACTAVFWLLAFHRNNIETATLR